MNRWKLCIIHSFLFFTFIGFTKGLQDQQLCNPSCGGLLIQYPFRLKGGPINCGESDFELTCSGNRTFLQFQSGQFLVKNINYISQMIKIIEVGLLRSNCSLPLKSLETNSITSSTIYQLRVSFDYSERSGLLDLHPLSDGTFYARHDPGWVSFMNCSKKLSSRYYQLIPCLSQKESYVYATLGDRMVDLAPTCSFLSMMPRASTSNSHSNLLQAIQDGFFLTWYSSDGFTSLLIRQCIQESSSKFHDNFKANNFLSLVPAVYKAEMHFPACIDDQTYLNRHIFRLSIVVLVIIVIVQLVIVLLLIGRLVFAPLTLCMYLAHKFWTIQRSSEDATEKFLQAQQRLSPMRYTYAHIIAITGQFKKQLGRGGFGSVYKGELPGGHFVAVKLLAGNSKCSGNDFISEVSTIGRIHHLNVIRLVGFCSEGSKKSSHL